MSLQKDPMYYGSYLHTEELLELQQPVSFANGNEPAHDEMLFIIIHQAYELWFKQILFELDFAMNVFGQPTINDNSEDLNLVRHRLNRITKILGLLNNQVDILDTMTPMDFLEFRNLLTPSSGFQSKQFRLIEAKLGLQLDKRHQAAYYKRTNEGGFTQADYNSINNIEEQDSLLTLINKWLERMPFFENEFWGSYKANGSQCPIDHPFWNDYRSIYEKGLTEREASKLNDFDYVFFEKKQANFTEQDEQILRSSLTPKAMRAGLFIMLYRDFPMFQTSYQILDSLVEIDHLLSNWRHKHLIMVRRMIGMRVGTGNTSGSGYLEGALNKHYIYKDVSGLSTYLIERKKLPKLPSELIASLSFQK
jgi:tryptophan 2,3-dioxygenase